MAVFRVEKTRDFTVMVYRQGVTKTILQMQRKRVFII